MLEWEGVTGRELLERIEFFSQVSVLHSSIPLTCSLFIAHRGKARRERKTKERVPFSSFVLFFSEVVGDVLECDSQLDRYPPNKQASTLRMQQTQVSISPPLLLDLSLSNLVQLEANVGRSGFKIDT